MSDEDITAVELLTDIGKTIQIIATNLRANRLDRTSLQKILFDYAHRAKSDGQLIYISRQSPQSVNRGLFLAFTHMEFISWLAKHNYTILSTSIKWYSLKQLFPKYRLPLLSISSQTADLRSQMQHIEDTAELVRAELDASNISLPPDSIEYAKVPVGEPIGPPPEAAHDLLRRGTIVHQQLKGT